MHEIRSGRAYVGHNSCSNIIWCRRDVNRPGKRRVRGVVGRRKDRIRLSANHV